MGFSGMATHKVTMMVLNPWNRNNRGIRMSTRTGEAWPRRRNRDNPWNQNFDEGWSGMATQKEPGQPANQEFIMDRSGMATQEESGQQRNQEIDVNRSGMARQEESGQPWNQEFDMDCSGMATQEPLFYRNQDNRGIRRLAWTGVAWPRRRYLGPDLLFTDSVLNDKIKGCGLHQLSNEPSGWCKLSEERRTLPLALLILSLVSLLRAFIPG
ncbi:MAG: hypothetical protein J3Q66DRAFT_128796 [Benniella sp.]|nr:MAG: hypothetical protein J3Q66DRAFT_128796 [Benniella sp.]